MSVEIAGVAVGAGNPCRVSVDLSNAHNGSLDLAKRIIRECAAAGADFIKFQAYTPDELVQLRGDGPAPEPWGSEGWQMADLYEKARTPLGWFPDLIAECKRVGIPWFSSVFGEHSLATMKALDCPAYKIAALDVDSPFATKVAMQVRAMGYPVIASSRRRRIPWADLTLYCPPGYPQDYGDLGPDKVGCLDGLSYHGTDWTMPAFAAQTHFGNAMVEVHVQLDDTPSELEANVSLTISQLRQLCEAAKGARIA